MHIFFVKFILIFIVFFTTLTSSANSNVGPSENVGGFLAGTIVQGLGGTTTIQSIKPRSMLPSLSLATGSVVLKKVKDNYRFQINKLAAITIAGEIFFVNPDHRFYLADSQEWIAAKDLDIGDRLLNRQGNKLAVEGLDFIWGKHWVFDLTVEETENYFVGKNQILVHNFAFVIPVATWTIGKGLLWTSAATVALVAGTAIVATEMSKISSNKQSGTIDLSRESTQGGRLDPQCNRLSDCEPQNGGGSGSQKSEPVFKTNGEAGIKAKELGFEKINERVNGQSVFRRGNDYITRDVDGHNGGAWKMAKSVKDLARKETRSGTYDANLKRIGD